jgi:N-acetylmuramoyl-L-alanine amidase
VQLYRRGDRGPVVGYVRDVLDAEQESPAAAAGRPRDRALFDDDLDQAVRAFQQRRGLVVDGIVGPDTLRALDEARRRLGDRILFHAVSHPIVGDDVASLQERLLRMGFDVGRCDGIFGSRTDSALRDYQRNVGLVVDGICGPYTLRSLKRLERTVVGGRPQVLRESEALRRRGPALAGKAVVVDPGHGGDDPGWVAHGISERDVVADVAARLEGRLLAAGMTAFLTHGPDDCPGDVERAAVANATEADLLVSLHTDGSAAPRCHGSSTYYYGTGRDADSVLGERFADLIQREIVARTDLVDCRVHAKTWELLRRTKMPAVRLDLGHLTNRGDAAVLARAQFRDTVAEAVLVAVQRLFLPADLDPPTGQLQLPALAG